MSLATDLVGTFVLGVLTPLSAVCVIPLYPGFLAYLSNRASGDRIPVGLLGGIVTTGVISFMLILGVVFSTILEQSLTDVIQVISPIAFGLLILLSIGLLLDLDFTHLLPNIDPPQSRHPVVSAFGYGFFFGAIVIPCNPAFIALFFARAFLFQSPIENLLNFFAFGLGIGTPLLAFALVSQQYSRVIIGSLTRHSSIINRVSGALMLVVSVYYLVVVFNIFGIA